MNERYYMLTYVCLFVCVGASRSGYAEDVRCPSKHRRLTRCSSVARNNIVPCPDRVAFVSSHIIVTQKKPLKKERESYLENNFFSHRNRNALHKAASVGFPKHQF